MEASNSKYDDILRRGRIMTIPLARWDAHVLNNVTKQENIDENGHNNDDSILKIGNQNIIKEEFSMETSKPSMLSFLQVFKRENIDKNGHNNDDSKSQIGPWYVVIFNSTNEVQHVPEIWINYTKMMCWFPYCQTDKKNIFFTASQIENMINKSLIPNEEDGTYYAVSIVAGPFKKALQSKAVSKVWSEKDSSDENDCNVKSSLSPKYPSPKKRRIMAKCARDIQKEFSPSLPKPPTSRINSTITSTNEGETKIYYSKSDEILLTNSDDDGNINTAKLEHNYNHKEDEIKKSSGGDSISSTSKIKDNLDGANYMQETTLKTPAKEYPHKTKSIFIVYDSNDNVVNLDTSITNNTCDNIEVDSVPTTIKTPSNTNLHNTQDFDQLTSFINDATNEDFLTDHHSVLNIIGNCSNTDVLDISKVDDSNERRCCRCISDLKSLIIQKNKSQESIQQQIMIQLTMLNKSNSQICKSIENLDYKVQVLMKADSRVRDLAVPIPKLPSALINIIPVKTNDELEIVEKYLSEPNEDNINYKEELKSYLFVKIGCNSSFSASIKKAINSCFNYELLSEFSYKGKTKRKFIDLKLFEVIYETLSGFRRTPVDELKFHNVTDNYLRHAPKKIAEPAASSNI